MPNESFFVVQSEASKVKKKIMVKYFDAWAKIMRSHVNKLCYIDFFSGPGYYEDGNVSTPIEILRMSIQEKYLSNQVKHIFNDNIHSEILKRNAEELDGYETLKHTPSFYSEEIGIDFSRRFRGKKYIPTLSFIDPWGYKGVTKELIDIFTKDFGCDCLLFFNYNRVNAAINNNRVENHMRALFGNEILESLRYQLTNKTPDQREKLILKILCEIFECDGKYAQFYRFDDTEGERTSHYLVFITKNFTAYKIMKEIMYKMSSEINDGIGNYAFAGNVDHQLSMFDLDNTATIDKLKSLLLDYFIGRTLSVENIVKEHLSKDVYIEKNYKEALKQLEIENIIHVTPSHQHRRHNTLGNKVTIIFPD